MQADSSTPRFAQEMALARQRFDALLAQLHAGDLDLAAFQAARQELVVPDESGGYWTPHEDGGWLYSTGGAWMPRVAPVPSGPPPPAPVTKLTPQKRRTSPVVWLLLLLLALGLGAVGITALVGPDLEPKMVQLAQPPDVRPRTRALSSTQQEYIAQYGYPDAFTLLFYEDDALETRGMTRLEVWSWYEAGLAVTLVNGEQIDSMALPDVGLVYATPFHPDQFVAGMSLEELLAASGVAEYLVAPLEDELVPDAESYFADQLTFGLKDGRLLYVEGMAFHDTES